MSSQTTKCPENVQQTSSREELLQELARCLKHARETQELSLEEAVVALKLRVVYLKALESGNWDEMPGEVYAIGFLKQYAAYLSLDISESVQLLKTGDYTLTKPLTFPDPPIAPNKTWVIIAALAFIVLFILFNLFDDSGFDRTSPSVKKTAVDATEPPLTQIDQVATPTEELKPSSETIEEELSDATSTYRYRLSAVGADVWLQLYSPEEPPVLLKEALLKPGESMKIDHISPSLLLTCGNPVALQVEIDDELIYAPGSLGDSEKVLRAFTLTVPSQSESAP